MKTGAERPSVYICLSVLHFKNNEYRFKREQSSEFDFLKCLEPGGTRATS